MTTTELTLDLDALDAVQPMTAEDVEEIRRLQTAQVELERLRARRVAERSVDAEELSDGVEEAIVRTVHEERSLPVVTTPYSINGLMPAGGRVVLAGYRKSGKTTMSLNLITAWANPAGGMFLGMFDCTPPREDTTVVWLNLELTADKAREWLHRIDVDDDTARALVAVHMRGRTSRYAVTAPAGRKAMVDLLVKARCSRLVLDPVAPMMAACGLKVGDPHDVAVFLIAMERVAAEAGVDEIIYVAHVSKSDSRSEGDETAMGASRWEDAADAIWIMGKEKESSKRWFRAEGRDVDVSEQTLELDEATLALTIDAATAGLGGRKSARTDALVERVVEVVTANPGIQKGELRAHPRLSVKGTTIDGAIAEAVSRGLITIVVGASNAKKHYPATP